MDIAKLDKNFIQDSGVIDESIEVYRLPCKEIDLYGTIYDKDLGWFQRMPHSVAKQITYNIEVLSTTTAGARARFKTNSKQLILSVKYKYLALMSNMPFAGSSGFSLLVKTRSGWEYVAGAKPSYDDKNGFTAKITLNGKLNEYILYFPLYNDYITEISLGFDKESTVTNGEKYKCDLPILYYGSSITQGGCASRPDNCYQAYVSKWNDLDFVNLGFSGGAKGEELMANYLATLDSLIFVCDYDSNAPSAQHLHDTHYNVYQTYRNAHPNTPIVIISKPHFDKHKKEDYLRLKEIKNTYLRAVENGDKKVYFIDGRKIFGKADRENCTVDGCHPNDLGFYRMAKVVDKVIKTILSRDKVD